MSHCPKCEKIIEIDEEGGVSELHPDCPGCGHEAELAALRAALVEAEEVDFHADLLWMTHPETDERVAIPAHVEGLSIAVSRFHEALRKVRV